VGTDWAREASYRFIESIRPNVDAWRYVLVPGPVTFYLNGLMSFGQDGGDRFWYGSMTAHVN
jgi:hypothetical protein